MTLILALPSKGRMHEPALKFFAEAGMPVSQSGSSREYAAKMQGVPNVGVLLLSAGEIAEALIAGKVHMGVTGEDLVRETAGDKPPPVRLIKPLGFGKADVVVAVPQAWIDVDGMADLDDVCLSFHARHGRRIRVATKYVHLTREFFAKAGIRDYRIVESQGATEGAPASGAAEIVVDITSTGATLSANQLKPLNDGVILKSQAHLAAGLSARWTPEARHAAEKLLDRVAARALAQATLVLRVEVVGGAHAALPQLAEIFGFRIAAQPQAGAAHGEAALVVRRDRVHDVAEALRSAGVSGEITAHESEFVFSPVNPLFLALEQALRTNLR